jgi:tetratricopeptide (TPR) repeat protein
VLVHLVRSCTDDTAGARMLVVGTYRDTDLDRAHPLTGTLADLRRIPLVERVPVQPLDSDEVAALIEAAAGHGLDDDARALAVAIHAETEGNPFFVGEVLRHLVETGAVRREGDRWIVRDVRHLSIPEGVREVVGRRLSRLSDQANSVMSVASVLGRDLDIRVLAMVVDCGEGTLLDALDEAARARIVEEAGADVWRFTHALVRTTLYEELSTTRRRRLHRNVADALEKLQPDDLTALAHHTLEAGPDRGNYHRAISYAIGAGEQALAARATGDALRLFNQALELLDEDDDDLLRSDALRGRGTAHHHGGEAARDDLLASARLALAAGDAARMAAALLADFGGVASNFLGGDEERIELIDAALQLIGPDDTPERAFLLTGLALELYLTPRTNERFALGEEAVAIARRLGNPDLLTKVLVNATGGMSRPATAREALARLDDVPASADAYWRVLADYWRVLFLELMGDVDAASAAIDRVLATLAAEPRPGVAWIGPFLAAGRAVMRGDLESSAADANRMLELMSQVGRADAFMLWAAIGVRRSLDDGTANDLVDTAIALVRDNAYVLGYAEALAYLCAEAGRMDDARWALDRFTLDGDLDDDFFYLADLGGLGLASVALGDEVRARRAMAQLLPFADWNSSYGVWSWCSVRLVLGVLADFLGDPDAAVDHLSRAIDFAVRTDRPLEEIRGRLALVAALRSGGRLDQAQREWEQARDLAEARGTDHLRSKVRAAAAAS